MPLQSLSETEAFSHLGPGSGCLCGREAQATNGSSEPPFDPLILIFDSRWVAQPLYANEGWVSRHPFPPTDMLAASRSPGLSTDRGAAVGLPSWQVM